jgi:hypothetical protein
MGFISGISCLGKQIKHNTKINQSMPGINFLYDMPFKLI